MGQELKEVSKINIHAEGTTSAKVLGQVHLKTYVDTFEEPVGALWQKENEREDAVGALPDPLASLLPVKYAHLPAIVCITVNGS